MDIAGIYIKRIVSHMMIMGGKFIISLFGSMVNGKMQIESEISGTI